MLYPLCLGILALVSQVGTKILYKGYISPEDSIVSFGLGTLGFFVGGSFGYGSFKELG